MENFPGENAHHQPSQPGEFSIFLPRTSPCCTGIHHASPAALRRNVIRYGSKWGLPFRVSKRGPLLCATKEDDKATKSYKIHFHRFPPMVFWCFLRHTLLDPPTHTSSGTTGILGEGTCWEHSTVSSDCSQHRGNSWTGTKLGGAVAPPWHGFTSRIFSVADTLSNSHANRVFVIISTDDQSHLQPKCFNMF